MSSHNAATHDHRELSRTTVVVCGHLGSPRSSVGLRLARYLHRPCVDVAAATIGGPVGPFTDERVDAEREWFEAAATSNSGHVIVAPCSVLAGRSARPSVWLAWLNVNTDQLVLDVGAEMPDLDIDAFRRHVRDTEPHVGASDEVIDTRGLSDDLIARQLADRFRTTAAGARQQTR